MAFPGSATKPGHHYHEPVIKDGRRWQRDCSERWRLLLVNQDWKGKRVIDYGCASGFFSVSAALQGAQRVLAFEADPEAAALAQEQARLSGTSQTVEVSHKEPGKPLVLPESDVLLLLSVVPWIMKTEINPWEILRALAASTDVAYVELMYAGDGRAGMAEVEDDADAEKWLHQLWPICYPVGKTKAHSGKVRTLWRCLKKMDFPEEPAFVGAQAFVFMNQHKVKKVGRPGRQFDPKHEAAVLHELRDTQIAPKLVSVGEDHLIMTRIQGSQLEPGSLSRAELIQQAWQILNTLTEHGIEHRDIRPENLILGKDGHLYLIDYGWASLKGVGATVPETINPDFRGKDDQETFKKLIDFLQPKT